MHQPSISQLLFKHLFPRPRQNDPSSFAGHVTRNIVPEVRIETATFYGALDCIEAQYPGLDYTYGPHRRRLSRFPWHRRLFRAFDDLRLTPTEILSICQWEGTKSAKDKYERDAGQRIRDTTADGVASPEPPTSPRVVFSQPLSDEPPSLRILDDVMRHGGNGFSANEDSTGEDSDMEDEEDNEDGHESTRVESYGVELNRRLVAAAEARLRGDNNAVFDEQWEQWLKEVMDRHAVLPQEVRQHMRERWVAQHGQGNTGSTLADGARALPTPFSTERMPTIPGHLDNSILHVAATPANQLTMGDQDNLNRPTHLSMNLTTGASTNHSAAGAA
ncbi:hypothetical protein UCRPC4_g03106 [Phaeomoniella chlamydospora]|uniref:Uncharacterized protein n=1 Tax=Phaeomoniella chlamydospora TaxID=158046 RepID=A0A0G2H1W3_PHACM|nr:hypothetical protein UCRPC4_g03106 [Phaeomoniella chlamydospora]